MRPSEDAWYFGCRKMLTPPFPPLLRPDLRVRDADFDFRGGCLSPTVLGARDNHSAAVTFELKLSIESYSSLCLANCSLDENTSFR